jgi:cytochrome c5
MRSKVHSLLGGSLVVWAAALAFSAGDSAQASTVQKTSNDAIYTKAQADGAKKQFDTLCADCHPFTVAAKKKPKDLPLGDEPFFENWTGRPLKELVSLIALTMPNDGSAVVSDEEAVDLVAYILQQNGFPAGSEKLTKETSSAVLARPKK